MVRKMIINAVDPEEVRLAVIDDGLLEHFDIETAGTEKNKGNIYKAKVIDVEPSLNAAFVDYGAEKQGFLTAGDVDPRLSYKADDLKGGRGRRPSYSIADLLRPKQDILVQVTKDEVGQKGAVLTTYLSLAGRYLVLTPDSRGQGVSRKIDDDEREALFETVSQLDVPDDLGVIVRTAGKDRSIADLKRDLKVLERLWENIRKEAKSARAPKLIYKDQDVVIRALRDYYTTDVDEVILDSDEAYDGAAEYMHMVMPRQRSVLTRYVERRPIFHHYKVEEQLEALFYPRVPLPSGGSIVIEPTEALVAIDVNSGKQKSGGHEETAAQTNVEATIEIARQLRLRDLGGIIVVDFIDMASRKNQAKVERVFKNEVKSDKARIKLGRISRNGTLEITRQRIRTSLAASVFRTCSVCHGTGRILNPISHASAIIRKVLDRAARGDLRSVTVRVEPEAANLLRTEKWTVLQDVEQRSNIRIDIVSDPSFSAGQDDFTFQTDPNAIAVEPPEPNFGPVEIPEEMRAEMDAAQVEEEKEVEAEQEVEMVERAKRRRQRRRGGKPDDVGGVEGEGRQEDGSFDLPSFELVDLSQLGLRRKDEVAAEAEEGNGADRGKKRRRRRRRGGRRPDAETSGGLQTISADAALRSAARGNSRGDGKAAAQPAAPVEEAAPPPPPPPPKKKGFFARLFGR